MNKYILGSIEPALFFAALFFAALGIMFILLMGTTVRDPNSVYSPHKFSWKYLFNDNFKRILASILATVITLRFMTELTGWELSPFKGFVVGTAWDGIALFVKQKTNWLDPKTKEQINKP